MTFTRASLLNAIAVAARMGSGLAINKLLAVVVGPAGFPLVGQLQNVIAIATTVASGGTLQGVIKYTAEQDSGDVRIRLWRTATMLALGCCLVLVPVSLLASPQIAGLLFGEPALWYVIVLLALALPLIATNNLLLAIANGLSDIRTLVLAGIAAALATLVVVALCTLQWGLPGALAGLAVAQAAGLPVTLVLLRRKSWLQPRSFLGRIDPGLARKLGGFVIMAATTAIVTPLTQIATRQWIVHAFGVEAAGYWEGLVRLSMTQLLFFTSALSAWYLPQISRVAAGPDLLSSVRHVLVRVVPVVALSSYVVWLLREPVIRLLFDPAFLPMADLFAAQMVGDTLKIASWIYAFVMIGRGLVRPYVVTEVVFSALYFVMTVAFAQWLGFWALSMGHAGSYLVYLVVVIIIVRRYCARSAPATLHAPAGEQST
ncbi:MAG: O-antigen translocase [Sphingomonadaceae bacterium]